MTRILTLAGLIVAMGGLFWACAEAPGHAIPLHGLQRLESEIDSAPVDLRVVRLTGPASLQVGSTWELRAEARDPEGDAVRYRWKATTGTISQAEGSQTRWTATSHVGRAEVEVEAVDPAGNLVRGAFGVAVPYDLPLGPVMDVRDSVGFYCSLEIDTGDRPHIAFHNSTHPSLHYAYHDGSEWSFEVIEGYGLDVGGAAGLSASLELDSAGNPHIAYLVQYADQDHLSLNYATRSGATWSLVTVGQSSDHGLFAATLKINPTTSKPEILYNSSDQNKVNYAKCSGDCTLASSWNTDTIYTETRAPQASDNFAYAGGLDIQVNGTRHASIAPRFENENWNDMAELIHAVDSGSGWDTSDRIIDLRRSDYEYRDIDASRLVLDRDNRPLVLHNQGVYHDLGAGVWSLSEVEKTGMDNALDLARFDIACDRSRTPPSTGVVWMASPHGGALELVQTDARGYFEYTYIGSIQNSTMAKASLAVDSDGQAHLCWVDGGVLMYQ